jgi:hypothetical protein
VERLEILEEFEKNELNVELRFLPWPKALKGIVCSQGMLFEWWPYLTEELRIPWFATTNRPF